MKEKRNSCNFCESGFTWTRIMWLLLEYCECQFPGISSRWGSPGAPWNEGKMEQVCVARVSGVLTRLHVGLSRFYLVTGICQTLVRLTGCMSLAARPFLPSTCLSHSPTQCPAFSRSFCCCSCCLYWWAGVPLSGLNTGQRAPKTVTSIHCGILEAEGQRPRYMSQHIKRRKWIFYNALSGHLF